MFENGKKMIQAVINNVGQGFEHSAGWVMKLDPNCIRGDREYFPFVYKDPSTGRSFEMNKFQNEYVSVKEIFPDFPDLGAMRACVVNYLSGKEGISDLVVDEILALGDECFWIEGYDGEQTRGFSPRSELSSCPYVSDFRIEKHGDIFLVGIG